MENLDKRFRSFLDIQLRQIEKKEVNFSRKKTAVRLLATAEFLESFLKTDDNEMEAKRVLFSFLKQLSWLLKSEAKIISASFVAGDRGENC